MNKVNKNKQKNLAEFIMLGLAFAIITALIITGTGKMETKEFIASSFVLSFIFTGLMGKEFLFKAPLVIIAAEIIGAIAVQKLTLTILAGIIFGTAACIMFLLALSLVMMKIAPTSQN